MPGERCGLLVVAHCTQRQMQCARFGASQAVHARATAALHALGDPLFDCGAVAVASANAPLPLLRLTQQLVVVPHPREVCASARPHETRGRNSTHLAPSPLEYRSARWLARASQCLASARSLS
eukprot:6201414-Pleurochrysis_carterae.AAC.1